MTDIEEARARWDLIDAGMARALLATPVELGRNCRCEGCEWNRACAVDPDAARRAEWLRKAGMAE